MPKEIIREGKVFRRVGTVRLTDARLDDPVDIVVRNVSRDYMNRIGHIHVIPVRYAIATDRNEQDPPMPAPANYPGFKTPLRLEPMREGYFYLHDVTYGGPVLEWALSGSLSDLEATILELPENHELYACYSEVQWTEARKAQVRENTEKLTEFMHPIRRRAPNGHELGVTLKSWDNCEPLIDDPAFKQEAQRLYEAREERHGRGTVRLMVVPDDIGVLRELQSHRDEVSQELMDYLEEEVGETSDDPSLLATRDLKYHAAVFVESLTMIHDDEAFKALREQYRSDPLLTELVRHTRDTAGDEALSKQRQSELIDLHNTYFEAEAWLQYDDLPHPGRAPSDSDLRLIEYLADALPTFERDFIEQKLTSFVLWLHQYDRQRRRQLTSNWLTGRRGINSLIHREPMDQFLEETTEQLQHYYQELSAIESDRVSLIVADRFHRAAFYFDPDDEAQLEWAIEAERACTEFPGSQNEHFEALDDWLNEHPERMFITLQLLPREERERYSELFNEALTEVTPDVPQRDITDRAADHVRLTGITLKIAQQTNLSNAWARFAERAEGTGFKAFMERMARFAGVNHIQAERITLATETYQARLDRWFEQQLQRSGQPQSSGRPSTPAAPLMNRGLMTMGMATAYQHDISLELPTEEQHQSARNLENDIRREQAQLERDQARIRRLNAQIEARKITLATDPRHSNNPEPLQERNRRSRNLKRTLESRVAQRQALIQSHQAELQRHAVLQRGQATPINARASASLVAPSGVQTRLTALTEQIQTAVDDQARQSARQDAQSRGTAHRPGSGDLLAVALFVVQAVKSVDAVGEIIKQDGFRTEDILVIFTPTAAALTAASSISHSIAWARAGTDLDNIGQAHVRFGRAMYFFGTMTAALSLRQDWQIYQEAVQSGNQRLARVQLLQLISTTGQLASQGSGLIAAAYGGAMVAFGRTTYSAIAGPLTRIITRLNTIGLVFLAADLAIGWARNYFARTKVQKLIETGPWGKQGQLRTHQQWEQALLDTRQQDIEFGLMFPSDHYYEDLLSDPVGGVLNTYIPQPPASIVLKVPLERLPTPDEPLQLIAQYQTMRGSQDVSHWFQHCLLDTQLASVGYALLWMPLANGMGQGYEHHLSLGLRYGGRTDYFHFRHLNEVRLRPQHELVRVERSDYSMGLPEPRHALSVEQLSQGLIDGTMPTALLNPILDQLSQ
ncbi:MAG: hypothetical protein LAT65_12445 [Saccharospirillum sp.]|nr:hypothetical protein [Saccharospirillum sp.]